MKKKLLTVLGAVLFVTAMQAQDGVGIGTVLPDAATVLDISSTNKGVLFPRVALNVDTKLNGGNNPVGVVVFNSGVSTAVNKVVKQGFYFWTGAKWELLALNSEVIGQLDQLNTDVNKKFTDLIMSNVGGGTSYLMAYDPTAKVFNYLKPTVAADKSITYTKETIDFKKIATDNETITFMKEIKVGAEVTGYVYFNEKSVKDWMNVAGNKIEDIPNANGVIIDLSKIVSGIKPSPIVINSTGVPTNEVIDNVKVYIGRFPFEIVNPTGSTVGYNTTIKAPIVISTYVKAIDAKIFDKNGNLVATSITDIVSNTGNISFHFGVNKMYSILPVDTGYTVMLKYISNVPAN